MRPSRHRLRYNTVVYYSFTFQTHGQDYRRVETREDTIPSANPFVTSVQKVAPIVQTGETTMTKTSQPKDQRKVERTSTQTTITMV